MPKFTIEVWLAENTRDSFFYSRTSKFYNNGKACQAWLDGDYTPVRMLEIEANSASAALDIAYHQTQNLDAPWNPDNPCRSVSVGDILKIGTEEWIVAPLGFDRLDIDGYFAACKAKYEAKKSQKTS